MTKPTPEGGNSIEKLLEDRAQFVSWLTRLNSSGGAPSVPEAVRGRVRSDYERRLEAVLEELRGHTAALEGQVQGLEARAAALTTRESELKEQLAEAEVRHVVGEYDDSKWEGIRTELLKVLAHVRDELAHTRSEIDRLSEVLSTIRSPVRPQVHTEPVLAPSPPAPPQPSIQASGPRPAVATSGVRPAVPVEAPPAPPPAAPEPPRPTAPAPAAAEIPFRPQTPRPQPKAPAAPPAAKKEDQAGRTLWFPSGKPAESPGSTGGGKIDELAFLKSVTGNEASAAPPAPPPPAPTPPPAAPSSRARVSGGFKASEPLAPPPDPDAKAPSVDAGKDRGSGQKTLKCAECGTLNRPTEWYCERCGSELAAL